MICIVKIFMEHYIDLLCLRRYFNSNIDIKNHLYCNNSTFNVVHVDDV